MKRVIEILAKTDNPQVTAHHMRELNRARKKRHPLYDFIDKNTTYIVHGYGEQETELIPLAYGTYTMHYSFAGDCAVDVHLIHAGTGYCMSLLRCTTGTGSETVDIPEDGYFTLRACPRKGTLTAWELRLVPAAVEG